jgi:hypothetical protein
VRRASLGMRRVTLRMMRPRRWCVVVRGTVGGGEGGARLDDSACWGAHCICSAHTCIVSICVGVRSVWRSSTTAPAPDAASAMRETDQLCGARGWGTGGLITSVLGAVRATQRAIAAVSPVHTCVAWHGGKHARGGGAAATDAAGGAGRDHHTDAAVRPYVPHHPVAACASHAAAPARAIGLHGASTGRTPSHTRRRCVETRAECRTPHASEACSGLHCFVRGRGGRRVSARRELWWYEQGYA